MAIDAEVLTVYDGGQTCVIQVIGKSDGQSGEEEFVVKVDVSELNPPCSTVRIEEIQYDVEGGGPVTLSWDDSPTPKTICHLKGSDRLNYRREGGLQNLADPQSRSGDILLSTADSMGNATYTVLLKLRKKFA
jgi:hypothetical protein